MTPVISTPQMHMLMVLAEELHFGRAAARLRIAPPQLSLSLRRIEEVVGVRIFIRRPKVQVTPAGEALLKMGARALSEIIEGIAEARAIASGETGTVRLGFTSTVMFTRFSEVVTRFQQDQPRVQIRFQEKYSSTLVEDLRRGEVDLIVSRENADDEKIVSRKLIEDRIMLVVPERHPANTGSAVKLADFGDETLIFFRRPVAPAYHDKIFKACRSAGYDPAVVQEIDSWSATLALVRSGYGITLGTSAQHDLRLPGLAFCEIGDPLPDASFWLSHCPAHVPPAARRLLDRLNEAFA
jgi:DNA-binding transcriptional LysR family regulator